jgi:signal transduction histidine kinase
MRIYKPRASLMGAVLWTLLAAIFLFDIFTPPENVAICMAYTVPIFMSLFEMRPRALFYASITTVLSGLGWLVQSEAAIGEVLVASNLLVAIVFQWLVAILVRLQTQRFNDALERAETQRRLVNVLSHEVGTALTVVTGQASRLVKLSAQLEPSNLKQRAEKIRDAALRIDMIIDRIRFASFLGDGSISIERGAVNLHTLLRQLKEQLEDENRGRTIELDLCEEPQVVNGDEVMIRQMIENVILNSVKYSDTLGRISVSLTRRVGVARIAVVDQGSGMSEYDLARVIDPFYRGENSRGVSGTGIGLYIVQQIVKAHKGLISIESALGVGTKVAIDLPQSTKLAQT